MLEKELVFQPINVEDATEHEYASLGKFNNVIEAESHPDDPPTPLDEYIQDWKNIPAFVEHEAYIVWDETRTKIIASCRIAILHTGDNEHTVRFMIEVLPEFRNQGIGREALKVLLPFAKKHKRTLWLTFTWNNMSGTVPFLERIGADRGLEMKTNQLKLDEFDKSLVESWLNKSDHLKEKYDMRLWNGPVPDEHLVEFADLIQGLAKDQPRDDLKLEDWNFTPEIIRQNEKNLFAQGYQRWTMYIVDRANGKIIGLTEVFWNPNKNMILNQGFTAVISSYRSQGLGRWLKAEMMNKILTERPEVKFIRTGNANSNAPMLKINIEMGFKPYIANTIWQVETEKIEKYLSE